MRFRSVHAVTWTVPDLGASVAAFRDGLDFQLIEQGPVSQALASRWQTPAMAGASQAVLQPANGASAYVRLVESEPVAGYAPLMTHGWNAVEFLVQDVHGLAERLAESPFEIIGPPRDLLDNDAVIAMQVKGPGDVLLYLTEMRHAGLQKTFGAARCPVDRFFICILGVANQPKTVDFYRPFAVRFNTRRQFRITSIARAHGLDPETARFDIASVVMTEPYRIETDAYPETALPRPVREGELPPGLALVSIWVDDADATLDWEFVDDPAIGPYRSALIQGPDDELVELLATGD